MEHYFRINISDITYMSELTPHPASKKDGYGFLGVGLSLFAYTHRDFVKPKL